MSKSKGGESIALNEGECPAACPVLAREIPRITLRKGVKQIPRHQELAKKDFVFVNPASIGPNLNQAIACYQQIFNVR